MNSKKLDQFYTKKNIAQKCYEQVKDIIKNNDIKFDYWLEPSAGEGVFYNLLPNNKVGVDLEPKKKDIISQDFLKYELKNFTYITIGNPPFGRNSSLAIRFFNKCAKNSALIAFIVPKTFKKYSTLKKIDPYLHLVFSEDLPEYSFLHNGKDYDVPCVFQIWKKEIYKREDAELPKIHPDLEFTTKDKATLAIQRVGVNAGRVKKDLSNISEQSHYFIKATQEVEDIIQKINWDSVKYNTAGNPSISKTEIIFLYQQIITP